MERPIIITTDYYDYTESYQGDYKNYFQLHVYSIPQIISTYYNPDLISLESVKDSAQTVLKTIRQRSNRGNDVTMFEKNGKFLITEHPELIDQAELLEFNRHQVCYTNAEIIQDFYGIAKILGSKKIDHFIQQGFISVGAEELFQTIEPLVNNLRKAYNEWETDNDKLRQLNKTNPKFIFEIYKIEKDYTPNLIESVPIHSEDAISLPEYYNILRYQKRITYLIKDLKTNKIVEGNLKNDIEGYRLDDETDYPPSLIDANALRRMELDDNDRDFLSFDDYLSINDDFED